MTKVLFLSLDVRTRILSLEVFLFHYYSSNFFNFSGGVGGDAQLAKALVSLDYTSERRLGRTITLEVRARTRFVF